MKDQDRARFKANIEWFNQFFDGVRSIYEMVASQLPMEYFPSANTFSSDNFYYPRQKVTPSLPAYYALLLEGFKHGLQILTIVDANLISKGGFFVPEPSIVAVVHNMPDKNSWLDEFALNVVKTHKLESIRKVDDLIFGRLRSRFSAEFFSFQVALDKFTDDAHPEAAVSRYIVTPIISTLQKGFPDNAR